MLRNFVIGLALGPGWYGALLIPAWTRRVLLGDGGRSPLLLLLLLLVTSGVLTTLLPSCFGSRHRRALCSIALPMLGTVLFCALVYLSDVAAPARLVSEVERHGTDYVLSVLYIGLWSVPAMAAVAYLQSLLVSLPLGFVHVAALRCALRRLSES